MLTIKDSQAGKEHVVPPEGATIGREGGGADIIVRSPAVSKRHARLFSANGGWWLKDLGSANGTFVGTERLNKPFAVTPGLVFLLSSYRFEVVAMVGEEEAEDGMGKTVTNLPPAARPAARAAAPTEMRPSFEPPPQPAAIRPAPQRAAAVGRAPTGPHPSAALQVAPLLDDPEPLHSDPEAPLPDEEPPPDSAEEPASGEAEVSASGVAGKISVAAVMKELPKAIAFYLVTVPKLLFNPKGTILDSVENQRHPAMKGMQLLAWALPGIGTALAVSLVCSFLVVVINAIRGLGFGIGALIGGLIFAAAVTVGLSLLVAFFYHPVLKFIIKLLKGESDDTSRTNYLIISQAAAILGAVPSGLSILVLAFATLIPVAAIGALLPIVPSLIGLGSSLITVALAYVWFKYFNVHKVVPLVILVLGGLLVLSTLWGMIGSVRGAVASIGSGGTPAAVVAGTGVDAETLKHAQADTAKAQAQIAAAQGEAAKAIKEGKAQRDAALKQAQGLTAEATKAAAEATKDAVEATRDAVDATKGASAGVAPAHPSGAEPPEAKAAPEAPKPVEANTAFQAYAEHRAFVFKRLAADPTLLRSDAQVLTLVTQLQKIDKDVRKRVAKGGAAPADDYLTQWLVEADAYPKARGVVDELYRKLAH